MEKEYIAHVKVYKKEINIFLYGKELSYLIVYYNNYSNYLKIVNIEKDMFAILKEKNLIMYKKYKPLYYTTEYVININIKLNIKLLKDMCNDSLSKNVALEIIKLKLNEEFKKVKE